ncbi:hypothetical protein F4802DRAFT_598489 [Xylaria palmicola]|nr:hypothetical protein F4802DRAFT_598489 [Xylaria palmicola]
MLFSTLALAAASSLAFFAEAAPTNELPGLVTLKQFTSRDGASLITVYGDAEGSQSQSLPHPPHPSLLAAARDLDGDCGGNTLVCNNKHLANREACAGLIHDLASEDGQAALPESPRSICGSYGGSQCCVSWHNPVSGAVRASLVNAALKTLEGCAGNTGVSGKTMHTYIGETCTNQCLSDRPKGC